MWVGCGEQKTNMGLTAYGFRDDGSKSTTPRARSPSKEYRTSDETKEPHFEFLESNVYIILCMLFLGLVQLLSLSASWQRSNIVMDASRASLELITVRVHLHCHFSNPNTDYDLGSPCMNKMETVTCDGRTDARALT